MLIIVGIPSLSITHWVIHDRIESTKMWHSASFQNNLARAQDLMSASEKQQDSNSPTAGVTASYDNTTAAVMSPLLPSSLAEETAHASSAVRFNIPTPSDQHHHHRNDEDDLEKSVMDANQEQMTTFTHSTHLTLNEKFHSFIIRSMVYCQLIVVVDPADVRGLEAIGMGVANTISQSLRMSQSIHTDMEPPVYTGDNDYDESGVIIDNDITA